MKFKNIVFIASLLIFAILIPRVHAATLSLISQGKTLTIGEEFSVDVKVDTDGVSINAAQVAVTFPANMLEPVSFEKNNSIFNFWVAEPEVPNESGILEFIGGTAKGVSGSALQIVRLIFKARGSGEANISLTQAVVTASDGRGTNVLSEIKNLTVGIGTRTSTPPPQPIAGELEADVPEKVVRQASRAVGLPAMPELRVPAYPDRERWYNHLGEVIVLWNVPADVTRVATAVSQNPNTVPSKPEPELFNGKNFGLLGEGIWYTHVQFRNNVGWGETAHYRIAIDTGAPLPFEARIDEEITDNPSPTIVFETQDSLSGISHADIILDGREPLEAADSRFKLPAQLPAKHKGVVRIFDFAGNSIEDDFEFEILPLPQPTLSFLAKSVSQYEVIFASGKSVPNGFIDILLITQGGQEVFRGLAQIDSAGSWETTIDQTFPIGSYILRAQARDERGAISFPTDLGSFRIKPKSVLSVGFIELGWFEITMIVVLIFLSGLGFAFWYYSALAQKRRAYGIIAARDVDKLTALLTEDLRAIGDWLRRTKALQAKDKAEARFHFIKMKETILKMKKYLGKELEKLK